MPKSSRRRRCPPTGGRLTESIPILLSAAGKPPLAMAVGCRNIDAGGRSDRHRWRLIGRFWTRGVNLERMTDRASQETAAHPLHLPWVGVVPRKDPTGFSYATGLSKGSLMAGWVSPDPGWGRAGLSRCAAGVCGERAGILPEYPGGHLSAPGYISVASKSDRAAMADSVRRGVPSWAVAESSPARTCLPIANRVFGPKALHSPSSQATVPDAQREEFFRLRYRVC
jgi:hypothetical protein